jgi:transcriptional regulator with XRE-family HTH domain
MEGDLQRAIGRNLRQLRRELGLSQEGLAERLGYSRGYVSDLELGKRNLSLRSFERLAADLDTSPLALLTGDAATYKSVDQ